MRFRLSRIRRLEHHGPARRFAERLWFVLGGTEPAPLTVDDALERVSELHPVTAITVIRNGQYWNILDHRVRRPNGGIIEIDRHYRCWTESSRAAAFATLKQQPLNDAIPY